MDLLASYSSDESDGEASNHLKNKICDDEQNLSSPTQQDYFNLNEISDEDSTNENLDTYEVFVEATILNEKCCGPIFPEGFVDKQINPRKEIANYSSIVKNSCTTDANPNKKQKVKNTAISSQNDCLNTVSKLTAEQVSLNIKETVPIFRTDPKIAFYATHNVSSKFPKHCIKTLRGHSSSVTSVSWCVPQYSHLLLSASMDCSLKIWDIINYKQVQNISIPYISLKCAKWTSCGTKIICGGYGRKSYVFDIISGKELIHFDTPSYVTSIQVPPESVDVFLIGVRNEILVFDARKDPPVPVKCLESNCGQILDMIFINEGRELLCSTEIVSHDSADRTIMAWDFSSGALLSNQIFQERYTCPCLQVEPDGENFVAQTNGNYIASFSTCRPYKMNRYKRYEGHKVAGYTVGCDFSLDGNFLASGDAEGGLYIYWSRNAHLAKRIEVKQGIPIVQVKWHPVLCSTLAAATWDGEIHLWQ